MLIRSYTENDFEGIVRVIHSCQTEECWPHYYPNGWDEDRIRAEFRPMKEYRNPVFLVSESDNKVTGLIAGHDSNSFVDNEIPHLKEKFAERGLYSDSVFYQREIIITRDHQKGTVGLRLFRAMKQLATEKGYLRLVTRTPPLNLRGRTFFAKLGYKEIFEDDKPERVYFVMA